MKYVWIQDHRDRYDVARMCRQLEVSRSGYCQWRKRKPSERAVSNAALDVHVASIYQSSKRTYGRGGGVQASPERVRNSSIDKGCVLFISAPFASLRIRITISPPLRTY